MRLAAGWHASCYVVMRNDLGWEQGVVKEVRVVCALPPSSYPETDYVRVHTCTDPGDDTVTLATIERVIDKTNCDDESKPRKRIKALLVRQPMTQERALYLAASYAERKKIPVVYAEG